MSSNYSSTNIAKRTKVDCWFCEKNGINPPRPAVTGIPRSDGNGFIPWCGEQECLNVFQHIETSRLSLPSHTSVVTTKREDMPTTPLHVARKTMADDYPKNPNNDNTRQNSDSALVHPSMPESSSPPTLKNHNITLFSIFKEIKKEFMETNTDEGKIDSDDGKQKQSTTDDEDDDASAATDNDNCVSQVAPSDAALLPFDTKTPLVLGWKKQIYPTLDPISKKNPPVRESGQLNRAYDFIISLGTNMEKVKVIKTPGFDHTRVVIYSDALQQNPLFAVELRRLQNLPKDGKNMIQKLAALDPDKPLYSVIYTVYATNPEKRMVKKLLISIKGDDNDNIRLTSLHHAGLMILFAFLPDNHPLRQLFNDVDLATQSAAASQINFAELHYFWNVLLEEIKDYLTGKTSLLVPKQEWGRYLSYYYAIECFLRLNQRVDLSRKYRARKNKSISEPLINIYTVIR